MNTIKHFEVHITSTDDGPTLFKARKQDCVAFNAGVALFEVICANGLMGQIGIPIDSIRCFTIHPVLHEEG